ncbi:hypothetical protein SAMN04488105_116125 [Salipiger thiooxidans]|uniref:Uncharacterized protein n=1 Tax=Salipiger thiooxidans TaxID=282683 RepID=A0A1G7JZ28_9RHOB|nr:hypothetical protein [Salipiger thiooxidans]SDF30021.1 hypothetical protein SAMN04488105_116125 [Salipiger thiooxidans]
MRVSDVVDCEPVPRVVIAATAVAMCRGGLVECVELARHLKLALCAFADRAPPSDLREAAEAACDLVDAVRDGDVPVFDHRRDRLRRALARYWAARARDPTMGGSG